MNDNMLTWQNGTTPRSTLYNDIYFSTDDGLAESRAVFLDGIGAPEIWQGKADFTIGELGFGTGLNFFVTVKMWLNSTSNNQKLKYIATEKHPLDMADINQAMTFPDLNDIINGFPESYHGEAINLYGDRVELQVLIGDSCDQLSRSEFKADGWFLDGFSPSKNPDMWSDALFAQIARCSTDGSRLATFTAAGNVRRSLTKVGFKISKRPGFGKKRERIVGVFSF